MGAAPACQGASATLQSAAWVCAFAPVAKEGKRAVALFGVKDLVVVAVGDAVMVCPKDRASDLKKLVSRVEQDGLHDLL